MYARPARRGAERLLWPTVACALALSTAACSPAPDIKLPAEWTNSLTGEQSSALAQADVVLYDHLAPDVSALVRPDGTGTFTAFPLWNGQECTKEAVTPYSGEFHWRAVDGYFQVDTPNSPLVFRPDAQMFSDNWSKLVVGICGNETPPDQRLVYLANFPINHVDQ